MKARKPFTPLNGAALLLSMDAAENEGPAQKIALGAQKDLKVLQDTLKLHFPVFVLLADLEKLNGASAFLARFPEERRKNRLEVLERRTIGRLGRDPEGRATAGGSKVVRLNVATDEVWSDQRGERQKLATICPSAILGPVMPDDDSYSLEGIQRLLDGMPAVPEIGFSWVDVRDVSAAHIAAMEKPEAGGQRFIASGPFLWLLEVSEILREKLPELAKKAPTRKAPKFMVRIMAIFDPGARPLIADIGQRNDFDTTRAKEVLGVEARPLEETFVECAESLAARG